MKSESHCHIQLLFFFLVQLIHARQRIGYRIVDSKRHQFPTCAVSTSILAVPFNILTVLIAITSILSILFRLFFLFHRVAYAYSSAFVIILSSIRRTCPSYLCFVIIVVKRCVLHYIGLFSGTISISSQMTQCRCTLYSCRPFIIMIFVIISILCLILRTQYPI